MKKITFLSLSLLWLPYLAVAMNDKPTIKERVVRGLTKAGIKFALTKEVVTLPNEQREALWNERSQKAKRLRKNMLLLNDFNLLTESLSLLTQGKMVTGHVQEAKGLRKLHPAIMTNKEILVPVSVSTDKYDYNGLMIKDSSRLMGCVGDPYFDDKTERCFLEYPLCGNQPCIFEEIQNTDLSETLKFLEDPTILEINFGKKQIKM